MDKRMAAAALAVVALLGSGACGGSRAITSGDDSGRNPGRIGVDALDGVDLSRLASGGGVVVSEPAPGYVARTSIEDATRVGSGVYPGVAVRQVLLAHVKIGGMGIGGMGIDTQAWIVSFDPTDPNLDPPHPGGRVTYALALVDAGSGQLIYSLGEQAPPPGGFNSGMNFLTPGHPIATPAETPAAAH
jgi:hypothetical protein